jgi:dTDP-4-amino-4,6-dideoxygalactose transaminase
MPIFNSLGSNYDCQDVCLSLKQLLWPDRRLKLQLQQKLEERFDGRARLLFNGRDAIEYVLKAYEIGSGDQVLTQAFSCSSVEEAIVRVGAEPIYFDLSAGQVRVQLEQVKTAYQQASNPKLVILQHTLGYADAEHEISRFCQKKDLLLVADLAQAVGSVNSQRQALGLEADAIVLSFGRDKLLDSIAGGAAIFKNEPSVYPSIPDWFELSHDLSNKEQVVKLLCYPLLTKTVRLSYELGIGELRLGKFLHKLFKKTNLIWTAMRSPHKHFQSFPAYFAPLALRRLENLDMQLEHRRKVAHFYFNRLHNIQNSLHLPITRQMISYGSNLRFPVEVNSAQAKKSLINYLKRNQVYVADSWYRQVVDSGSVQFETAYQPGSCPNAEKMAKTIVNLPTHRLVNLSRAEKIYQLIQKWIQNYHAKN